MTEMKTTDAVAKLVDILTPLPTDDRSRVVRAALTLLGDEVGGLQTGQSMKAPEDEATQGLSPRARLWVNQNGISVDELQQVFHLGGGTAEVIASEMPGKSDKERTYSAYILTGVANLLARGETSFSDKAARDLCKSAGCLNAANHSLYIRDKGNEFAGSKEKGWTLTSPGLRRGAVLVKELSQARK
jgi:hypothetical protein